MELFNRLGRRLALAAFAVCLLAAAAVVSLAQSDPLPSWNDGAAKTSIIDFVTAVTEEGGADYVAPSDRIATFDNDGNLWGEQPRYVQLAFALDRIKAMSSEHPEWQQIEPFKSVLANDMKGLAQSGHDGLAQIIGATHAGMTSDEFTKIAIDWIETARHPQLNRPYTSIVYQPMLEVIQYLKANNFKVFIVSGAGVEFMRPWTEEIYGIPPENVVGSLIKTKYEVRDGIPTIVRLPEVDFIDDKAGKPVGILKFIGKRPIAAFGNSDGDFEMLEWTTSGLGRRFGMILHHDDAEREYAYDRNSDIGRLSRALDEAPERGWTVVSMKNDWKRIYPQ